MGIESSTRTQWHRLNTALVIVIISISFFVRPFAGANTTQENSLPISIRAASQADYSHDTQTYLIPPINETILDQIIADGSAVPGTQDQIVTVEAHPSSATPALTIYTPSPTPTPTSLLQKPTNTVTIASTFTSSTPIATTPITTATPQATLPATSLPSSTPVNTSQPGLPLPTIIAIPSLVPTILPIPTLPPILPTIPPILSTIPPLLPTILPGLPTIPPLLP